MSTVASLPPDIIIHIVTHLPLQDVVSILSTCQELRRLPYTYPLAFHAYFTKMVKVHVLAGILDIPTTPLPVSHPMGAASASFAVDDAVVEEKNEPILSFQKVKERSQSTDWVENYGNISKFITYLVGMTSNSTQLRKTLVAKNTSMSNDEKFLTSVGSGEVELANRCPLGEISLQSNAHVSSTLMKVLSNVPNLTSLNLADTAILDTNVQTLSSLQFLQSLDLSGTSLSLDYIEQNVGREDTRNSGATPSADAHTSAFHVDLRTKSAKSSHALSAITTLTSLDLSRCPFLLSEKLYNLQTLVRLRSLNLSMSGDQCVDVGGKKWKVCHTCGL